MAALMRLIAVYPTSGSPLSIHKACHEALSLILNDERCQLLYRIIGRRRTGYSARTLEDAAKDCGTS